MEFLKNAWIRSILTLILIGMVIWMGVLSYQIKQNIAEIDASLTRIEESLKSSELFIDAVENELGLKFIE